MSVKHGTVMELSFYLAHPRRLLELGILLGTLLTPLQNAIALPLIDIHDIRVIARLHVGLRLGLLRGRCWLCAGLQEQAFSPSCV